MKENKIRQIVKEKANPQMSIFSMWLWATTCLVFGHFLTFGLALNFWLIMFGIVSLLAILGGLSNKNDM